MHKSGKAGYTIKKIIKSIIFVSGGPGAGKGT